MPRFRRLLFLLLLLLAGSACQNTGSYKPDPMELLREKISLSSAAARSLTVADANEVVEGGLLRVQVRFDNRAHAQRSFRTLFEWFDARGMKIASANEVWNSHIIRADQTFTVGGTATSPDAKDWRMQVETWDR